MVSDFIVVDATLCFEEKRDNQKNRLQWEYAVGIEHETWLAFVDNRLARKGG
jgi:hypothetical protein